MDRRTALLASAAAAAAAAGGCAGIGGPPTIMLSQRELTELLERNFPLDRRLLEVFDVTLSRPRVQLQPERNRLAAQLALAARERLLGVRWSGTLAFDAGLRWEPRDRSLRLAQVRVNDLAFDGGGPGRSGIERLAGAVVERVIDDFAIYTLPAERADQLRRRGWVPDAVAISRRGVEITFAAVAA